MATSRPDGPTHFPISPFHDHNRRFPVRGLSSNWTENRVKPERYGGRARCGSTRSKLFAFDRSQIIQAALNLSHTAGTDQCCEVGVVLKHFLHFRHLPEGVPDKEEPAVEASCRPISVIQTLARSQVVHLATARTRHFAALEECRRVHHLPLIVPRAGSVSQKPLTIFPQSPALRLNQPKRIAYKFPKWSRLAV